MQVIEFIQSVYKTKSGKPSSYANKALTKLDDAGVDVYTEMTDNLHKYLIALFPKVRNQFKEDFSSALPTNQIHAEADTSNRQNSMGSSRHQTTGSCNSGFDGSSSQAAVCTEQEGRVDVDVDHGHAISRTGGISEALCSKPKQPEIRRTRKLVDEIREEIRNVESASNEIITASNEIITASNDLFAETIELIGGVGRVLRGEGLSSTSTDIRTTREPRAIPPETIDIQAIEVLEEIDW